MTPAAQDRLLDEALGSEWRAARLVSGQHEVRCPSGNHEDRRPSFHVDPEKRVGICRSCGFTGGAFAIASHVRGEDRAREIVRSFDAESLSIRNTDDRAGSRRLGVRELPRAETLGPVTDAQRKALGLSRRVRDEKTYEAMRIDRVRVWGEDWIRIPALDGSKLWAVDDQGIARGEKGKLQRRNVGPVSVACSPALREAIEGDEPPRVERLYDVEGESDLLALYEAGAEFVLSTTGGASSLAGHERHADALLELDVAEVVVVRDRDDAGRGGAAKAAEWWRSRGVAVRVVELPDELGEAGDLRDYLNGKPKHGDLPATEPLGDLLSLEALADAAALLVPERIESDTPGRRASLVRVADVATEPVEWLWEPYLPSGKLSLLVGDPGVGKTFLALAIAAAVTRGRALPGADAHAPANVVYLTGEDGVGDTLRPRLEAAGADVGRVFVLDGVLEDGRRLPVSLADLDAIGDALQRTRPALIVVDPVQAYLGGRVDMHRANEVRPVLEGLARLAAEHECAALAIAHMRKAGDSRAIYRALGSVDFVAIARSMLVVGSDPEDAERRIMAHGKSSLAPSGPSLAYRLDRGAFTWAGESSLTADELVGPRLPADRPRDDAQAWLRESLADGPRLASELREEAEAARLAWRTVQRAAREAGVDMRRRGFAGGSEWSLAPFAPLAPIEKAGANGESGADGRGDEVNPPHDSEWLPLPDPFAEPPGELDL